MALAVSVSSPGGFPVQSHIISEKIQNFAAKKNLKLYTFAKDVAASGGYFILSVGDHVCADRSSIVGSIGVRMAKTNLRGLLDYTSLEQKRIATNDRLLTNILNPFDPISEEDKKYIEGIGANLH